MPTTYLRRRDINDHLWNQTVSRDPSALPYAYTWWLDAVTNGRWNGLVLDDYRGVLPLPYRWQFGRYTQVQRPAFTQQCGPFGQLLEGDVALLLNALPQGIRSLTLPLREGVSPGELPAAFSHKVRTNLLLNLDRDFPAIQADFHRVLRRKLRKYGEVVLAPAEPDLIIEHYRQGPGKKAGLKTKHYTRVRALMEAAADRNAGLLLRANEPESGVLLAAGFFPFQGGRLINLFAASSDLGYQREGMARLLVGLIKEYCGQNQWFDFEGSDIPGVAEYFRSFGPEERPYITISNK